MKYTYLLFALAFACTSPEQNSTSEEDMGYTEEVVEIDKKKSPKETKESLKLPLLTHENASKVLSKFAKNNSETVVLMKTSFGNIKMKLYEETPLHRANFLQLVKREYFTGTVFYRVVKGLIVQAGNLDDRSIRQKRRAIGSYRIPSEFRPLAYFHKRGALASPRRAEGNPDKRSNPFEFYIVQGGKPTLAEIQAFAQQNKIQYSATQIQAYTQLGGLPHLDNHYTVFGEVIEGLDVVDKIAEVEVSESDNWPLEDIFIEDVEVIE